MTQAQRFAAAVFFLGTIYILTYLSIIPVPLLDDDKKNEILPVIPWWLLVSFGSYSLWSLGWGLLTFRDCPEAYQELLSEITTAKNELRMQGVSVDS
ncbi:dolichol-phosphate mannosyltransferase subunit 3 [Gautieria morchelliformis]|nr:dolichol-phosphate mannosyltransferase subunit 3 [Gautieria morchelliformis]